jgi:hypothetical protein
MQQKSIKSAALAHERWRPGQKAHKNSMVMAIF